MSGATRPGPPPLRPSTAVPPAFSTQRAALPAIRIEPSGRVTTTQILKQQLANELGLPLRDLRIVDPSYPNQIQATFMSRKKAILFCIENIKVVVQHHEALVFSPFQPEVQEFVPALQQQIAQVGGVRAACSSCLSSSPFLCSLPSFPLFSSLHSSFLLSSPILFSSPFFPPLLNSAPLPGRRQRRGRRQPRGRLPLRTRGHRGAPSLPRLEMRHLPCVGSHPGTPTISGCSGAPSLPRLDVPPWSLHPAPPRPLPPVQAALNVVCTNLFRRVRAISPAVASALTGLRAESRGLEVLKTQVNTANRPQNTSHRPPFRASLAAAAAAASAPAATAF